MLTKTKSIKKLFSVIEIKLKYNKNIRYSSGQKWGPEGIFDFIDKFD